MNIVTNKQTQKMKQTEKNVPNRIQPTVLWQQNGSNIPAYIKC